MMILFYWVDSSERAEEREKKSRFETGLARLPFARISPIPYRLERSAPFPPRRLGRLLSFNFLPPSSRMTERRNGRRAKRRRKKKKSLCLPSSSFGNRFAYLGTAQRKKRRPRVIVVIYSSPTEPGSRALAFLPFLVHLGPSSLFYSGS